MILGIVIATTFTVLIGACAAGCWLIWSGDQVKGRL